MLRACTSRMIFAYSVVIGVVRTDVINGINTASAVRTDVVN